MLLPLISMFGIIGLICLNLDLGNRIFGSYKRTILGAFIRILFVVIISVFYMLPFLFLLLLECPISFYLYGVCFIFSVLMITIYLFPPRWGIKSFQNQFSNDDRHDISLKHGIYLHNETIQVDFILNRDSLSFLVISDLHCNTTQKLNLVSDSIQILKTQDYDAMMILGDLTEQREFLPPLIHLLSEIKTRYGIYCVRGNHDFENGRSEYIKELMQEVSITILSNQSLNIPELGIDILGLEYPWNRSVLPSQVKGLALGISHTPDNIKLFNRLGVAVVVAGHTHGGKFNLPLIGAILVPSCYGRFLCKGWFIYKKTLQYITRGIGYFPGQLGLKGEILQLKIVSKYDKI